MNVSESINQKLDLLGSIYQRITQWLRLIIGKQVVFIWVLLLTVSCNTEEGELKQLSLTTINMNMGIHEEDTTYSHFIVVNGLTPTGELYHLIPIVENYLDTCSKGIPVSSLNFYSSGKGFSPNQLSQDWEAINKNHIVSITLDRDKSGEYKASTIQLHNPAFFVIDINSPLSLDSGAVESRSR